MLGSGAGDLTASLSAFSAEATFADLPGDVVHTVKRLILDVIGNALGGWSVSSSKYVLHVVRAMGGNPQSTVFLSGERTSILSAVIANVTLATGLQADDTLLLLGHHGQSSVLPALAVAEERGASGQDLLTAVAMAYELSGRIAYAARHHTAVGGYRGTTSTNWVIFAAAVGAAKALGLDAESTAAALGTAGYATTVPGGGRWNCPPWTPVKNRPYLFLAMSGTLASLLASAGYLGDREILDGSAEDGMANWWEMSGASRDPKVLLNGLGTTWLTPRTSFKPWPSCRHAQGPLGLLQQIMDEHGLSPDDIKEINVTSSSSLLTMHMDSPLVESEEDCQFSVPHMMAMLAYGVPPGPQWGSPRRWAEPDVVAFKSKVHCRLSPEADKVVAEQMDVGHRIRDPHSVEVLTTSGQSYLHSSDFAVGDPHSAETTMSDERLFTKFRQYSELALPTRSIDRIIDTVMTLESLTDIRTLTQLLA